MTLKRGLWALAGLVVLGGVALWLYWPHFAGIKGTEGIEQPRDARAFRPQVVVWQGFLDLVVDDRGFVRYDAAQTPAARKLLDEYVAQIARATPAKFLADNDRLAFYINAYNALVIHGVLRYWPISSVDDAGAMHYFFRERAYVFAGQKVSLHGFETNILRKYDPRMHFAINCASYSCPPLSPVAWYPETLEQQLEKAKKAFIRQTSSYDPVAQTVTLSKIFEWYEDDFGGREGVLAMLSEQFPEAGSGAEIVYDPYDWSLNQSREDASATEVSEDR